MWQTELVVDILAQKGMTSVINSMETIGDKILDTTIAKIGSKGVFTVELEEQLLAGITDIAVHSAKDMQSQLPQQFALIAFTSREKVNDVLLSDDPSIDIADTGRPLVIGTSSVRRRAFLHHYYPHVKIVEMRGNLQTRLSKMRRGDCDALMLAFAGVKRMGYDDLIVREFPADQFVPPVGQGCIAIEAAVNLDATKRETVRSAVNDLESELCLLAERAFLKKLEGGCSIPAFGYCRRDGEQLVLTAGLASLDGAVMLRVEERGDVATPEALGRKVGEMILAQGGRDLLAEIRRLQEE